MQRLIALLAVASGLCGISYELLYARLLTTWLGDMFHVGASILAVFLLGIAAGSRVAHRFRRFLWAIELGIGAYAVAMAETFARHGRALQEAWLPMTAGSPLALVGVVAALLLVPALAIGFSVPLFALLARDAARAPDGRAPFRAVYRLYNAGAAACVLAVEFVVLRRLGIHDALLLLAGVNLVAGVLLAWIQRGIAPAPAPAAPAAIPRPRAMLPLLCVSVVSGVYQMLLYKLAEMIFGPFHENFAIVLALTLAGIATGTAIVGRWPVPFARWLGAGSLAISLSLLLTGPAVWLWAAGNGMLSAVPALSSVYKILVLALVSALPLGVFGGTIPALLRELPDTPGQAGRALAVSGLGNCAGYLLMVLWLYAAAPDWLIVSGIAVGVLLAGVLAGRVAGARPGRGAAAAAAAAVALAAGWPSQLLHYGYDHYTSLAELRGARRAYAEIDVHRRFDSQISLLRTPDGDETVVINGYTSLVSSSGRTNLRELIYGVTPALFSARRDRALVLGVGTGITAGATAGVYAKTTAVEVNPSMLALLPRFSRHNGDLAANPDVTLVLDDGLSALLRADARYDAIVNTVTSPLYFSSSKLYTREFFDLVSDRLADGGVYALWFDGRVTEVGARVVFRTLAASFADCAVTYLNTTYLQLVCGNAPLAMRDPAAIDGHPRIRSQLAAHGLDVSANELLSALVFPAGRLFTSDWRAPENRFDRPVLEFLMASRGLARQDWWSPYDLLAIDETRQPGRADPLAGGELARRCYLLRVFDHAGIDGCLTALAPGPGGGDPLADYAERVARYERATRPILPDAERLRLAEQLIGRGALAAAGTLIEGFRATPRIRGDHLRTRARLSLARGETLSDEDIGALFTAAPLDPAAREVIVRALASRGRRADALAHARFLPSLGVPVSRSLALASELGLEGGP